MYFLINSEHIGLSYMRTKVCWFRNDHIRKLSNQNKTLHISIWNGDIYDTYKFSVTMSKALFPFCSLKITANDWRNSALVVWNIGL